MLALVAFVAAAVVDLDRDVAAADLVLHGGPARGVGPLPARPARTPSSCSWSAATSAPASTAPGATPSTSSASTPGWGGPRILNIPRDTWVDIPGHGQGRINEAYRYGGPQLQAQTVQALTGAPISYVLTTTFAGLIAMVDALGGARGRRAVPHARPQGRAPPSTPGACNARRRPRPRLRPQPQHPRRRLRPHRQPGPADHPRPRELRGQGHVGPRRRPLPRRAVPQRPHRGHRARPTSTGWPGPALALDPGTVRNYTMPAPGRAGGRRLGRVRPPAGGRRRCSPTSPTTPCCRATEPVGERTRRAGADRGRVLPAPGRAGARPARSPTVVRARRLVPQGRA